MAIFAWSCLFLFIALGLVEDASSETPALSNYMLEDIYNEIAAELGIVEPHSFKPEWYTTPTYLDKNLDYDEDSLAMDDSHKWVELRRPEEENKVVPSGYQFVSGGAGEGKQQLLPEGTLDNKQEVKTDADLPAYCSPPNPCPKGKTGADGCLENMPDTALFNRRYIQRQMLTGVCGCDYEHMNEDICPQKSSDQDNREPSDMEQFLNGLLEKGMGDKFNDQRNPYLMGGEKRDSLTAKKGGQHILTKRSVEKSARSANPYLQGLKLPVVAKKSPQMN